MDVTVSHVNMFHKTQTKCIPDLTFSYQSLKMPQPLQYHPTMRGHVLEGKSERKGTGVLRKDKISTFCKFYKSIQLGEHDLERALGK